MLMCGAQHTQMTGRGPAAVQIDKYFAQLLSNMSHILGAKALE